MTRRFDPCPPDVTRPMAYRFQARTALDADIRRIMREQIVKAIADLGFREGDRHEAVHEARKRFKKLRGLLILARPAHAAFARAETARYRDAARALSGTRDRTALIEALDELERHVGGEAETDAFAVVRTALELKREAAAETLGDPEAVVAATIETLQEGQGRLDGFVVKPGAKRRRATVTAGLQANYARARRDLRAALRSGDSEAFHDLRKRIKYLAMHLKLLADVWPEALTPLERTADAVAEDLGRDHDYAVLRAEMEADPASFGAPADLAAVRARLDRHQEDLRAGAVEAVSRLLADKPKAFAARMDRLIALAETRDASAEAS